MNEEWQTHDLYEKYKNLLFICIIYSMLVNFKKKTVSQGVAVNALTI